MFFRYLSTFYSYFQKNLLKIEDLEVYSIKKIILLFLFLALLNLEQKNIYFFGLCLIFFLILFIIEKSKQNFIKVLLLSFILFLPLGFVKSLNLKKYFFNPYKIEKIEFLKKNVIVYSKKNKKVLSVEDYFEKNISYGDILYKDYISQDANFIEKYKTNLINKLFSDFNYIKANFLRKILFGENTKELKNIQNEFFKTGNLHLLAISGFHIGLLFFIFSFFLRKIRYNNFLIFLPLGIYIFLTNFTPSALRAFLFLFLIKNVKFFSLLENLFLAGIIYLVIFKFTLGFTLSFLGTFAILISLPSAKKVFINTNLINISIVSSIFRKFQIFNFFISLILTPIFSVLFILLVFYLFFKFNFLKPFINICYQIFYSLNTLFSNIFSLTFLDINMFPIFLLGIAYTFYTLEKFLRANDQ